MFRVSWYHLISSPSAFWTVWHVFLHTHLCLWAGSNDCTHRRHLGFFWFGAFMKTSDSLAHCSLVILDSSHIVLVSYDISLEPLSQAGLCSFSCYWEYKAKSQNHGTASVGSGWPKKLYLQLHIWCKTQNWFQVESLRAPRICPETYAYCHEKYVTNNTDRGCLSVQTSKVPRNTSAF